MALPLPTRGIYRVSTPQQVAAATKERLLRGEVAPGTRLEDHELALALRVSRHSVREAIQILASERLVRQNLHRGAIVMELGIDELADLYRARQALELAGVRAAPTVGDGSEGSRRRPDVE